MIRPQPRAAMPGPNRWPSRNGAVRLTAMVVSHWSADSSGSGGRRLTPAQLTRMSGSPNTAAASSAPRATAARLARSALTQAAWPPSADSDATAFSSAGRPRAMITTRAPAPASAAAMAWPMPELPPVTTATRPSSPNSPRKNPAAPDPEPGPEPGRAPGPEPNPEPGTKEPVARRPGP